MQAIEAAASIIDNLVAGAFNYLSAVRSAQERYLAKDGCYADSSTSTNLDITQVAPKYFDVGTLMATAGSGGTPSWELTLARKSATSSYGAYTVRFTQDGFDASTGVRTAIMNTATAEICPMGN
jgi:hypothetical protein